MDSPAFKSWIGESVRKHMWLLLGVQSWNDDLLARSPSLTDQEYEAFVLGQLALPDVQNFRIDFVRPAKKFDYNKLARAVFCTDFHRAVLQGVYVPPNPEWRAYVTDEVIVHWWHFNMYAARAAYRRAANTAAAAAVAAAAATAAAAAAAAAATA